MIPDNETRRRREAVSRLATEQAVLIETAESSGTGFLVAPDTVLTCAHVVRSDPHPAVTVHGRTLRAEVVAREPRQDPDGGIYAYPDLAVLRLPEPLDTAGVWLADQVPPGGSDVIVHGFSDATLDAGTHRDTLYLSVVGRSGEAGHFVRLKSDQVVQGFSGSLVLDPATGRVCGVLKTSRDETAVLGGWMVPVDAVRTCFPELARRNGLGHRPGTAWYDLAMDRAGRQVRLFGAYGHHRPRQTPRPTPAQLLTQGAMPFVDRPELTELRAWCADGTPLLLRLLHAPGGSGKTRLAAELCRLMAEDGWLAGFVQRSSLAGAGWLDELTTALDDGLAVLAVFDYAQARLEDIRTLVDHVSRFGPEQPRLRLLLLARTAEPFWRALQSGVDDWALADASVVELPRTIPSVPSVPSVPSAAAATATATATATGDASPAALVVSAFEVFARRLGHDRLPVPRSLPSRAGREDSLLGVLALALDAVLTLARGSSWSGHGDPLERLCDHEVRVWHAQLTAWLPAEPALAGEAGRLLAEGLLLVPVLAPGRRSDRLIALLERVRAEAFPHHPPLNMNVVNALLRMLYPAEDGLVAPVGPSRIGEILVRRVLSTPESSGRSEEYLLALLDPPHPASPQQRIAAATETVEILARARGCTGVGRVVDHPAHPALDAALARSIAERPDALLPALAANGAVLPHAEPLAALMLPAVRACGPDVLAAVESRLPGYPSSMSPVAALVLKRLLDQPDPEFGEEDQLRRLRRLISYSLRLDETAPDGPAADGLAPGGLAPGGPAPGGPASDGLAPGGLGADGVRPGDSALTAAQQAVRLSRDLVRQTGRHLPEYARALHNVSLLLHRAHRTEPALEHARSAVAHYEELLAGADGDDTLRQTYLLDTATVLSTLALVRMEDGQVSAALDAAAHGVELCEEAEPGARQDDTLLTCLQLLARCGQLAGRPVEAVAAGYRALALLRELADQQPGRYLARLPEALHRQAIGLVRAGRDDEAYRALREAAQLRAALPPGDRQRLAAQRSSLRMLVQLSSEITEFTDERAHWVEQLATMGNHGR
ncbi:trypsin-like peptidase domain-containing protein [Kitasatospora sp. NPDC088160]|uniref:trypsin-like peptidase domain-containing protein n=1 Tax=Kitasatospora sp. NPDC088160 TaxID=3364072 RepID=UPI0037FCF971